jgi:hypothetical protein
VPSDEEIRQRIIIEGVDGALKELEKLGDEGAAAIDKIKAAGDGDFGRGLQNLSPELTKFSEGLADAELAARKLPGTLGKSVVAAQRLGQSGAGAKALAGEVAGVGEAALATRAQVRGLSIAMRALAHASGVGELSILSRVLRTLGISASAIAPLVGVVAVGAIGAIAASAVSATQKVQDLAFAMAATPQVFQEVLSAAVAVGGSVEKFGAALSKQPQLIKQTVQNERQYTEAQHQAAEATRRSGDAMIQQLDQIRLLARGYQNFRLEVALGLDPVTSLREQVESLEKSYRDGKVSVDDYSKSSTKLYNQLFIATRQQSQQEDDFQKSLRDANKALSEQIRAEEEAARASKLQKQALADNATALEKLNISGEQFKRLNLQERMQLVAEKLIPMAAGFKRNSIAAEIFGDDARSFIRELDAAGGSFNKFVQSAKQFAPAFTPVQNAIGDQFSVALGKAGAALVSLKDQFGIAVAPAFVDFLNTMAEAFAALIPIARDFGSVLGTFLKPLLDGIAATFRAIVTVIQLVAGAFNLIADLINRVFGTSLTGAQLFLAALVGVAAALFPVVTGITLVLVALGLLAEAIKTLTWDDIVKAAQKMWDSLTKLFDDLWVWIQKKFFDGLGVIGKFFDDGLKYVIGLWESFKSYLQSWVDAAMNKFKPFIDLIKRIGAFFSGDGASSGTATAAGGGFAEGGKVRGPGTGTSDSILAWLSNGEFVMRWKAVQKYGVGFMHALNHGKLNLDKLAGFNMGGLVSGLSPVFPPAIPRFADGGHVSASGAMRPVAINFQGTQFNAMMTDEAIDQLSKKSIRARSNRAGRSPSWVGR